MTYAQLSFSLESEVSGLDSKKQAQDTKLSGLTIGYTDHNSGMLRRNAIKGRRISRVKSTQNTGTTEPITTATSVRSTQLQFQTVTSSLEASPVNLFQWLESVKGSPTFVERSFLKLLGSSKPKDLKFFSLKTLKASFQRKTGSASLPFSIDWMNSGIVSNGKCLTLQTGFPKQGSVSSLLDICEKEVPARYYLSPNAVKRLLNLESQKGFHSGGNVPLVAACLTPNRPEKRQNGRRFKEPGETMFTLTAQDIHGIYIGGNIRTLTERECERLQGFPDDWTLGVSRQQRYHTLGNAVTVPVIRYLGQLLLEAFVG
jgi:hypothetical protein